MRERRLRLLWLALVGALSLTHAAAYLGPFEDAFITYRYAENLAAGHGLVYNVGERVEGYTSFGWTVLLALIALVRGPIVIASEALSLAAGLACVLLAARLAGDLRHEDDPSSTSEPTDALAALFVAASGTWAYHATTGMETTVFASLVVGAIAVLVRADTARAGFVAGTLLGVSALVRPEGLGYAGLVVGALALVAADRAQAGRVLGVFLLFFVPFLALRWTHFGYPLPNTYYAKASPSASLYQAGLVDADAFLVGNGFGLAILAAIVRVFRSFRARGSRLALATLLGATVNVVIVGGDAFPFFRFFLPVIPIGAAVLTVELLRVANGRSRLLGPTVAVVLAGLSFMAELLPTRGLVASLPASQHARVVGIGRINDGYLRIGRRLRRAVPPGSLLAVNAAGIVPYESGLPTIDMLGLTDVHIAHRPMTLGLGTIGHEKHDAAYVLSRRPRLIFLGLPTVLRSGPITPERVARLVARYLPYLPGDAEMLEQPDFARWYDPVGLPVDDGVTIVFVRRSTPRAAGEPTPWLPR